MFMCLFIFINGYFGITSSFFSDTLGENQFVESNKILPFNLKSANPR